MSIKKNAIAGTKWTTLSMLVQVVVQLLRLSILTRFLTKADFGLVAIVTLILGFTHIFTDLGISVVLFSRHDLTKKDYSSLYWVSLLSGFILYILLLLSTPLVVAFYNLDILKTLVPIMGLDLIIATAGRQFKIFKQKQLRFKEIGIIEIFAAVLSLIVSVFLAYTHWGVYSLVYGTLLNSFISSFLLTVSSFKSHPIAFYINIRENKHLYKMGLYQTGAQILDFLSNQLDIIIIGKLMGPSDLGVYNLIKQLILRPFSFLSPVVQNVAIPILSKIKNDIEIFNKNYLQVLNIVSFIAFPLYALIAIFAEEILWILYGKAYVDAALPLQILCVWGAVCSMLGSASVLVVVTGKTNLGFNWTIFRGLTNPLFIIAGGMYAAVIGIATGQAVCIICYMICYWFFFIRKASSISFKEYISSFSIEFLTTSLAFLAAMVVKVWGGKMVNIYFADGLAFVMFVVVFSLFNKAKVIEMYQQIRNR